MKQIIANHPHYGTITRITKASARKLFNAGNTILVICSNFFPSGIGGNFIAAAVPHDCKQDFNGFVRSYEHYNCVDSETGLRAAFYSFNQDDFGNPA